MADRSTLAINSIYRFGAGIRARQALEGKWAAFSVDGNNSKLNGGVFVQGSQMKTIEDDPSITPGSVARSPLSISAAKESDLFATSSKASPTDPPPLSLTSSTWSFNPSVTQQNYTR